MNLTEKELDKFIQISCNCFRVFAPSIGPVEPQEPVIQIGQLEFQEYNGFIDLEESASKGKICLSMAGDFCNRVLDAVGETTRDDASRRDLVGELASIISNNAREHFGPGLKISVPFTLDGAGALAVPLAPIRFVLPLRQGLVTAYLMIALEQQSGIGAGRS